MELRQLKYFQLVSRLGNVTRAAEQCHVAQPAISIAIQKLEEELGIQLFDRNQKRFSLTMEGNVYLQRVDKILSLVEDSVVEMNDYRTLQRGGIRIGIPPLLGAFLFPYIFSKFTQVYPNLTLQTIEGGTLAIQNLLEKGELDVGIIMLSNMSDHLETLPITTGELVVCMPQGHPLSSFSRISMGQLVDQPFVLLQEDTYTRQLVIEEAEKHHFSPRIVFSSSQIETILGLVEQGIGISVLLDTIVRKRADIISRPLAEPLYVRAGLAWNKERYLPKAALAFIQFIKDYPFSIEMQHQSSN